MVKIVDGVEYLTGTEASDLIGGSRQSFYNNVKRYLRPYHFGARKSPWYSKSEVIAIASGKPVRKANIAITGMFADWTEHARSLGFKVQTEDREITVGPLPADIAEAFQVEADQVFVKRSRMSWVERQPICTWDTYYAQEYVKDILPQIRSGNAHGIIEYIAEKHGVIIGEADDIYSTRVTTFDEQSLFQLLNDEPLLILQRMARTADQKAVVFFQSMQLLGSWFIVKRHEAIHHWDK